MAPIYYRRHHFPPEIIQQAIWLYLRFTLSYRDVEELLAEPSPDLGPIEGQFYQVRYSALPVPSRHRRAESRAIVLVAALIPGSHAIHASFAVTG